SIECGATWKGLALNRGDSPSCQVHFRGAQPAGEPNSLKRIGLAVRMAVVTAPGGGTNFKHASVQSRPCSSQHPSRGDKKLKKPEADVEVGGRGHQELWRCSNVV